MRPKTLPAATLLCCVLVTGHAQAAPYQLTSHVGGVATYFNIDGYGFHDLVDGSGHTAFDITWRALIDYSGSGDYASPGYGAVELTIAINGQPAQTSTIEGLFFVDRSNFSSTPEAGTAFVTQSLIIMPMGWGNGLSFRQATAFPPDLASDPGSLPAHVPAGASSGRIEYSLYYSNEEGEFRYGGIDGQVTDMSFTLVPVPEPAGWAMLGAGLLLTGVVARRRVFQR
ncbi:PEP-CTERM sorting domain-containing protein [[Empedobacter] haloabium]|uniref:PEP-CTERM sorting domain-containing protein n=1 Tax=[Empedobacter] haloabium TaxID=592317 RepID=A0ABZ1USB1_9BURK